MEKILAVALLLLAGFSVGCAGPTTITAYQYESSIQSPPVPPGTPPLPPQTTGTAPTVLPYKRVYPSRWIDPTLFVVQNQSPRNVRVKIDEAQEISLSPYQTSVDLYLGIGEHRIRITIEKLTATFGILEVVRFVSVVVRPDGHSQIISIYD